MLRRKFSNTRNSYTLWKTRRRGPRRLRTNWIRWKRSSGQHTSQVGWRNMSSRMPWSNAVWTWRQSVAQKMGHFGRSGARHSRQRRGTNTTANCRRSKRLVRSGHRGIAGESESLRGGLTTDRSTYVGNHWLRLCSSEKVLLWFSGHRDGVTSAVVSWRETGCDSQLFEKVVCTTDRDSVLVYVVSENKQMAIRNSKRKLLRLTGK